MFAILDCGTTNTKCYVIDECGVLLAEGYSPFGVKDNTLKQDRENYKKTLRAVVDETCASVHIPGKRLKKVIAFGMISSDLGLLVVPHLSVPVGLEDLRHAVYEVKDHGIFDEDVQFLMIRGVKNTLNEERSLKNLEVCDFMRGEETQVMGILQKFNPQKAFNVIMFGSHVKIIHVDAQGQICQSFTTMSGQIFECICQHTVVGKSVAVTPESQLTLPQDQIIDMAEQTTQRHGLMRSLLLPRFMESFTYMTDKDRLTFLDAVIAIEDMKAIKDYYGQGKYSTKTYYFIGQKSRCQLFANVLTRKYPNAEIVILDGKEKNRDISIIGALQIANI